MVHLARSSTGRTTRRTPQNTRRSLNLCQACQTDPDTAVADRAKASLWAQCSGGRFLRGLALDACLGPRRIRRSGVRASKRYRGT